MSVYNLKDLCTFINGGSWSESEYVSEGIPVIKVTNLKNSIINTDEIDYISEKSFEKYKRNELKTDDVIVATVGSHPSLETSAAGRSAVVTKSHSGYLLNQNAVCIRSNKPKLLDQKFLGYVAKSKNFYYYIQNRGAGAANQMRIPIAEIKSFNIDLPSLVVQKKIAKILSSYDDLIENNLKRIELLEESGKLIYEDWFLNFKIDGKELQIDKNTNLPFGWKNKPITKFNSFKKEVSKIKKFSGEKIYYATADIDNSSITGSGEVVNWENKPSRAQIKPNNNTIWFARMSNTKKIICFNNKNLHLQKNIILSSGFAGFKAIDDACLPFLYFTIHSKFFNELKNLYATGATQVSLNDDSMQSIKINEPSIELVKKYGLKVLPLIEQISVLMRKNEFLRESRDILLPRLMTGMIDTEKMDIAV